MKKVMGTFSQFAHISTMSWAIQFSDIDVQRCMVNGIGLLWDPAQYRLFLARGFLGWTVSRPLSALNAASVLREEGSLSKTHTNLHSNEWQVQQAHPDSLLSSHFATSCVPRHFGGLFFGHRPNFLAWLKFTHFYLKISKYKLFYNELYKSLHSKQRTQIVEPWELPFIPADLPTGVNARSDTVNKHPTMSLFSRSGRPQVSPSLRAARGRLRSTCKKIFLFKFLS